MEIDIVYNTLSTGNDSALLDFHQEGRAPFQKRGVGYCRL
jgi:hypothetical protein